MPVAGPSASATSGDEPIRVVVTPSQASYFAGETFSVTITITNVRTQESPSTLPPRSASHSASHVHKRGAHSISSVPLARPPTSPAARTTLLQLPTGNRSAEEQSTGARRGLIGTKSLKNADGEPVQGKTGRRPSFTKSLSLSIAPHELESRLKEDVKGKSPVRTVQRQDSYNCV